MTSDSPPTMQNWSDNAESDECDEMGDDEWDSWESQQSAHESKQDPPDEPVEPWSIARRHREMLLFLDNLSLYGANPFEKLGKIIRSRSSARRAGFPDNIPLEWANKHLPELRLTDSVSRNAYIGKVMLHSLRGSAHETKIRSKIRLALNIDESIPIENKMNVFKFNVPFIGLYAIVAVLHKKLMNEITHDFNSNPLLALAIDIIDTCKTLLLEFVASGANSEYEFRPFILQLIDDCVNPQSDKLPSQLFYDRPTVLLSAQERAKRGKSVRAPKDPKLTVQICKNFLLGSCKYGANCRQPHMCLVCPYGTAHSLADCKTFKVRNHLFTKSYVEQLKRENASLKEAANAAQEAKPAPKSKSKK